MKKYDVIEFLVILFIISIWSYLIFVVGIVSNTVGVMLTIILSILIYVVVKVTEKKRRK